jgi:RNA polymerase sigma-70 factor, ECF subfamily
MKNYSEMTDKELVSATASPGAAAYERAAAFEHIVKRHCGHLSRFVSSRGAGFDDAQDAVQETFLRAFQNIDKFDCDYSLKNWLFTIAYRIVIGNYRKKQPGRLSDEEAGNLTASENVEGDYGWIWQAARQLGDESFTALWLRYKQDMNTEEIAKVMNKSKTSVRVLLYRSRKKLGEKIENFDVNLHCKKADNKAKWSNGRLINR